VLILVQRSSVGTCPATYQLPHKGVEAVESLGLHADMLELLGLPFLAGDGTIIGLLAAREDTAANGVKLKTLLRGVPCYVGH